jgi:hypothetical protein
MFRAWRIVGLRYPAPETLHNTPKTRRRSGILPPAASKAVREELKL